MQAERQYPAGQRIAGVGWLERNQRGDAAQQAAEQKQLLAHRGEGVWLFDFRCVWPVARQPFSRDFKNRLPPRQSGNHPARNTVRKPHTGQRRAGNVRARAGHAAPVKQRRKHQPNGEKYRQRRDEKRDGQAEGFGGDQHPERP